MPKNQKTSAYSTYLKYKFEILKRNKRYREDYKKLLGNQITRGEMVAKWGCWLDPDMDSEKAMKKLHFPRDTKTEQAPHKEYSPLFADLLSITLVTDEVGNLLRIDISINPEAPWQLIKERLESTLTSEHLWGVRPYTTNEERDILKVEAEGDEAQANKLMYRYSQRRQLPKKKLASQTITQALKIYDLKYNDLKTIEYIAEYVFSDIEEETDSIRKVNRYLKKARKMIATGKIW